MPCQPHWMGKWTHLNFLYQTTLSSVWVLFSQTPAVTILMDHVTCGLISALVMCKQRKEYGRTCDNKHFYKDQMSLNKTNSYCVLFCSPHLWWAWRASSVSTLSVWVFTWRTLTWCSCSKITARKWPPLMLSPCRCWILWRTGSSKCHH